MSDGIKINTDRGNLEVSFVPGPWPYVWIGDKDGNYVDSFDLEGSPLTRRRSKAKPRRGVAKPPLSAAS